MSNKLPPMGGMMKLRQALSLHEAGRFSEAQSLYEQVLKAEPRNFDAWHLLGACHQQQNKHAFAIECIQKAIRLYGKNPIFHVNLANSLKELGQFAEAIRHYDKALGMAPGHPEVILNRAAALIEVGRTDEARLAIEQQLQINPHNDRAWFNLAMVERSEHRLALAKKHLIHSLSINGHNQQALLYLAGVHVALQEKQDAVVVFDILLKMNPEHDDAWAQRGEALFDLGRPEFALESYRHAIERDDKHLGSYLWVLLNTIDHETYAQTAPRMQSVLEAGGCVGNAFANLVLFKRAQDQFVSLIRWVRLFHPEVSMPKAQPSSQGKIRLAYVSGDFKEHPVSYLTAELLELHDRSRFELVGVNINGKAEHDAMTERVSKTFDHYIVARDMSDPELWRQLRDMKIDIAIDLSGHTAHNRLPLFAHRIAPVQVNYLGFPGTIGAPYIDYIIGDETVTPLEMAPFYAEKLVLMPDTFQPNDRQRPIADAPAQRAEVGLPQEALVYCCFCNNYKYNPEMFDAWARILQAVPGSVLWLLANNDFIEKRIQAEMARRHIAADRIVFGGRLPQPQYLARYRLADLFLDTHPFNGGTTVSDALWAGLPVLTLCGEAFASRMAASLLKAAGLPHMITTTLADYEAQAIHWGLNPTALRDMKRGLMAEGHDRVLFDTPRYVKHLEQAYERMVERARAGQAPDHIRVEAMKENKHE